MSLHFSRDLAAAQQDVLRMGSLVKHCVHLSLEGLQRVEDPHSDAVRADESEIDRVDVEIEERCLRMLVVHQPVAGDLRRITAILRIGTELERMADLAENILERVEAIRVLSPIPVPEKLTAIIRDACEMVDRALQAYIEQDVTAAEDVCARDEEVDALHREIIDELLGTMRRSPELIEPALHLFSANRNVERIADHATNIAEEVIYQVAGEIVRHRRPRETTRQSA